MIWKALDRSEMAQIQSKFDFMFHSGFMLIVRPIVYELNHLSVSNGGINSQVLPGYGWRNVSPSIRPSTNFGPQNTQNGALRS